MNRRGRVDNIFNIEVAPPYSSQSSQNDVHSNDSRNPLTNTRRFEPFDQNGGPSHFSGEQFPSQSFARSNESLNKIPVNSEGRSPREQTTGNLQPNFLRTISLDGQLLLATNSLADLQVLTDNIRQDEHLMEDNPYAEQLRMDLLRAMPHSLTIKRQIKSRLHQDISTNPQDHKINRIKRMKYSLSIKYNQLKISIKSTLSSVELWYNSLKTIEGHFGSSVAAYFKFLRWLFILNIFLLIMTFGFITIPQILYNSVDDKTIFSEKNRLYDLANSNESDMQNDDAHMNLSDIQTRQTQTISGSNDFHFADLFTAEGFLKNSVLFYGGYSNATFSLSLPNKYSIPFAYFLTMLLLYIFTFVTVSVSMARSYRKSFIESYGGAQNLYAHKVFCSWDFGISIEKAAALKRNAIYNEIKEMLYENNHPENKMSRCNNFVTLLRHLFAHGLVFVILGGLAVGTWYFLKDVFEKTEVTNLSASYVSLFVNLTMFVIHYLFNFISKIEEYKSPRTVVHIQLLRNFLLEAVIIGVLLTFWLTKSYTECWETSIGQEIYRIVIVEFFVATILTSILQGVRVLLFKRWPAVGLPEFDISKGTLGLIFNQTLLWVGLLFSPLLATIIVFKILLTFYIKKFCLMYFCKLPTKLWRAAQTQTLYLVMIFLSILAVIIVQGYIMTQVTVSKQCGPFREYSFMFQILVDGILELKEGSMFWRIVMVITKPAVIGGILLTMSVVVYYLRAKSRARIAMVKLLKDMLRLEGEDKEFLSSNINKAQDWYSEHGVPLNGRDNVQDSLTESSSTWKFNRNRPSTASETNGRPTGLAASSQKRYSQLPSGSSSNPRTSGNTQDPRTSTDSNGIRNRRY